MFTSVGFYFFNVSGFVGCTMCSQGHRENRMKMVFTKLNNHLMSTSSEMSMFNRLLNHAENICELVCVFLNVKISRKTDYTIMHRHLLHMRINVNSPVDSPVSAPREVVSYQCTTSYPKTSLIPLCFNGSVP